MIDWAFWSGAAFGMAVLTAVIHGIRKRGPYSSRPGSAIYAIWVAEAAYGAGGDTWALSEAASYLVCGLVLWLILTFADKGRKAAVS